MKFGIVCALLLILGNIGCQTPPSPAYKDCKTALYLDLAHLHTLADKWHAKDTKGFIDVLLESAPVLLATRAMCADLDQDELLEYLRSTLTEHQLMCLGDSQVVVTQFKDMVNSLSKFKWEKVISEIFGILESMYVTSADCNQALQEAIANMN